MEFDFSKLNGRIVEKFGTRLRFAEAAGYTRSQLSARLNNLVHFPADEIYMLCKPDLLDLDMTDIPVYFFTPKVR
jgi:hypothetical protein